MTTATIPFWFFQQHFLLAFAYVIVYKSITFLDSGRFSGQDSRGLVDPLPVFIKVHLFLNDQDKRVFALKRKRKKSLLQTVLVRGGNIRHLSKWFFSDALFTLDG